MRSGSWIRVKQRGRRVQANPGVFQNPLLGLPPRSYALECHERGRCYQSINKSSLLACADSHVANLTLAIDGYFLPLSVTRISADLAESLDLALFEYCSIIDAMILSHPQHNARRQCSVQVYQQTRCGLRALPPASPSSISDFFIRAVLARSKRLMKPS